MKVLRQIIEIDKEKCNGCGVCVPACEEGAIQIVNGKAEVVAEKYCDGLGACIGNCPEGAITIIEKVAEEFDPEAVDEYLHSGKSSKFPCSCSEMNAPKTQVSDISLLSHWPVQIKLINPSSSFLVNSDILILADCAAVAYPNLHNDFLKGKVVMMGCPKFDNKEEYFEKFKEIFSKNSIKSITILMMEVPCCSGLKSIVETAVKTVAVNIPISCKILSINGKIKN